MQYNSLQRTLADMEQAIAIENSNAEEMQEQIITEYEKEKLRMLQDSAQQNQQITKLKHNMKFVQ